MAFHAKTVNMTHNLEVPGSSPGWSTDRQKGAEEDSLQRRFLLSALLIYINRCAMWESDGVSHIQVEELHLAHADAKPYGDYRPEQFTVLSHKMYI